MSPRKLVAIDLFAGAGGFSTGARQAGATVAAAANHWPVAVEYHGKNHPGALHLCQDLHQADWRLFPAHDLLLASPCCQGHSRARGKDTVQHDESRSTAWAVVSCAEFHRPRFVVVENVIEFLSWDLFPAWQAAMNLLGYTFTQNVLNAADFGVPQYRERLFLVGTLNGALTIKSPMREHVPSSTIIDWAATNWTQVNKPGRALATLRQIEAGREKHGDRFMIAFYGKSGPGRSLNDPCGTITTRDRFAIVDRDRMRMLNRHEVRRGMGFPEGYALPDSHKVAVHMLGNAVVPGVAKEIIKQIQAVA